MISTTNVSQFFKFITFHGQKKAVILSNNKDKSLNLSKYVAKSNKFSDTTILEINMLKKNGMEKINSSDLIIIDVDDAKEEFYSLLDYIEVNIKKCIKTPEIWVVSSCSNNTLFEKTVYYNFITSYIEKPINSTLVNKLKKKF